MRAILKLDGLYENMMITALKITPQFNQSKLQNSKNNMLSSQAPSLKSVPYTAQHLQANSNIKFKSVHYNELKNEYYNKIQNENKRPVESFLSINASTDDMGTLLKEVLSNDSERDIFIEDLTGIPRQAHDKFQKISDKVNDDSIMSVWNPKSTYIVAYNKYLKNKVQNARSIEAIVKHRPDWKEEVLLDKFNQLKGHNDFQIGNIPKDFPRNAFGDIVNHLNNFKQGGNKSSMKIPSLDTEGRHYDFEYFTDGRSLKNVYGVNTQNKKYVFKIDSKENRSLNAPFALGTLALIDNYLTLHRCRNSAPILYYNHECNASIYKFITHNTAERHLHNASEVNKNLPDFRDLGMCYNDTIGTNNYFVLKDNSSDEHLYDMQYGINNKELISVDNDHVTYSNYATPKTDYNKELPNAMGFAF